jgi:hypothetical protein
VSGTPEIKDGNTNQIQLPLITPVGHFQNFKIVPKKKARIDAKRNGKIATTLNE